MNNLAHKIETDSDITVKMPDIIVAAFNSDYKTVIDLLEKKVDVNSRDPEDGLTCLHIACLHGDEVLADIIIDHNLRYGDVNFSLKTYHRQRSAWQLAFMSGYDELGKKIDQAGYLKQPPPSIG